MFKKDTRKKVRETMNLLADLIDELAAEKESSKNASSETKKQDESIEQNNVESKLAANSRYTTIVVLLMLSLIFSITSLSLTIHHIKTAGNPAAAQEQPQISISQKYDKGQSLEKAIESKKPILVLFYADWCGFCQKFAPTFNKIAKDPKIKKNFAIAYVNCDAQENSKFVQEYGVQGFPTVFVIDKDGNRTQLDNNTFFNADSKQVVKDKALELIGEK